MFECCRNVGLLGEHFMFCVAGKGPLAGCSRPSKMKEAPL